MWFEFKMRILLKFFCILLYLSTIKCDCFIQFNKESEFVPKFEKNIGNFTVRVPSRKNEQQLSYIRFKNGESVTGSCETYFKPFTCYFENPAFYKRTFRKLISNQTDIVLNCVDGSLYFNKELVADKVFSCAGINWSIYSTKQTYSWCQKNPDSNTFLFAAQSLKGQTNILAAFCYNMAQLSLQTFVYNTTDLQNYNYYQSTVGNGSEKHSNEILDENIWNFKTTIVSKLTNDELQDTLKEMAKTNEWLNLANYEMSLIVQDDLVAKQLQGYEAIFNVFWWSTLRVGNWKYFQSALTHYAQNNSYELYVGTSGVAQYPSDNNCYKEENAELKLEFQNETVPAYIWTYLKSNDQLNKDFLIVGYNSPFAEYFTLEKVIFCPDICMEIPWLKEVASTFRYSYAGIMFCCSTDFIRQTQYLQGFPKEILRPLETTSTTEKIESL